MKVVYGLENIKPLKKPSVVAIGVFDGVHLGHQEIIAKAVDEARKRGASAVIITFDPHPQAIMKPKRRLHVLTSLHLKIELIEQLGADTALIITFTEEFSQLRAEKFAEKILIGILNTVCVVVGAGFHFGKGAAGDVNFLKEYGKKHNFDVVSVPLVLAGGRPISSTRIRSLLSQGDLDGAKAILGRYPRITGTVVKGFGRGSTALGFPTANIATPDVASVPSKGVYAGLIRLDWGKEYPCVIDIGTSPTFEKKSKKVEIHVHMPGLRADLYGQKVEVEIQLRIRDEKRFSDEAALKDQIKRDIEIAKKKLPLARN